MEGKEVKPRFKKGFWKPEEDFILKKYVETHGEGNWTVVSKKSGLMRGAKSCRLRWKNYLRPNIKRGMMSEDEKDLIIRLHKLLGNRWSLIAGRLPGRTDNEVKNYWNTHLNKRASRAQIPHLDSKSTDDEKPPLSVSSHAHTVQEENLEMTTMATDDEKPHLSVSSHAHTVQEENLETTAMAATSTKEGEIDITVTDSWIENLTNYDCGGMTIMPPEYSHCFFHNYEAFMPILDNLVLSSGPFGMSSADEVVLQETIFL